MEENIQEMCETAKKAFKEVEFWPQERVDEVVAAVAWEWQKDENVKAMAKLAVEEGKIGVYEDKISKIKNKVRGTMRDFCGVKTCGLVEEDKKRGIKKYAKPMGVVANIVPCTNPEGTVCTVGLALLKTRNAMICSPHHRTKKCSNLVVEIGRKALEKVGAPVNLFQCIKETDRKKTHELFSKCDFVMATGGVSLIKAVYSAGKPCHTVGAGNVVSIVDETANLKSAASKIMLSKTANNSTSCSSENAVAIHEDVYDAMIDALKSEGGYLCAADEREKLRKAMWPDGKKLNRDIFGRPAAHIASMAGIKIPDDTKFIMVLGEKIGQEDMFSGEKISLVLTVWRWDDFDEMLDRLEKILKFSGEGHSTSIHTTRDNRIEKLAIKANVGRVNCNMPNCLVNTGSWYNGHVWTESLGGGTWAGNMTSDNINYNHFLNYTLLSVPVEEYMPSDEEIFGDYLKKLRD